MIFLQFAIDNVGDFLDSMCILMFQRAA